MMRTNSRAQRNLVVLHDENHRNLEHTRQVYALVKYGRLGGPVTDPGQRDPRLLPILERQRGTRHDGDHLANM